MGARRTRTRRSSIPRRWAAVRERGYAANCGEWRSCIAAAVLGPGGPVAGLSVSTSARRMPEELRGEYGTLVTQAAHTLTESLT
ncbi:IclR family transcriptional regulator C-terminal domain-containing protein [Nonomuraea angiospora]|uniref:IclR family transcriptional regulator domain-containing protein n=1 Tax=Nonomuraea angiospora TaxID=46172 RepID=UPI00344FADCF